jgi:hypothetical protein
MEEVRKSYQHAGLFRLNLLGTACAISIVIAPAYAADDHAPTLWIELGGQLQRIDGGEERYDPSFSSTIVSDGFASPLSVERPGRYANGGQLSATVTPHQSTWGFSASLQYGRSNAAKRAHEERVVPSEYLFIPRFNLGLVVTQPPDSAELRSESRKTYTIADFRAGKDVGIGVLGRQIGATVDFGVRFAQFNDSARANLYAHPDGKFVSTTVPIAGRPYNFPKAFYHSYSGLFDVRRSFRGIGPSLGWRSSLPISADETSSRLVADWGVSGALLFGRQKIAAHTKTSTTYHYHTGHTFGGTKTTTLHRSATPSRSRSVIVPNLGAFAALSLNFPNAKISLGYRADFFFGAVDGGIVTRKTYDRDFYGPFATISIGLGG